MKDIFLVDMDDTLLDFERAERENFFETLNFFSFRADEGVYARFHAINDALWKAHERGEITREKLMTERFERLFSEYGADLSAGDVAGAYYRNFEHICFPFEGALAFLQALAARGRVYIVTNGGARIQRSHVRLAGFEECLSGLFISEEMGVHKPMAAYAEYVAGHIEGFERGRAVWIGDSPTSDKACAEIAGIDFLAFDPRAVTSSHPAAAQYADILRKLGTRP